MERLLLTGLVLLAACSKESRLQGQVVDVWGNPVEGATVVMEGQPERPLTDRHGRFTLPFEPGVHKVKAGREGYIQEHVEVEIPDNPEGAPEPVFKLYPKPEEAGFYVVGTSGYERLEPKPIAQIGSGDLEAFRGVRSLGDSEVETSNLRVVFHTPLKMDQVMRLGLELHQLEFVHQTEMAGPLERARVDVNLWTPAGRVPIEIRPLRSRNDYLIEATEALEPGGYAFDTQGMLSVDDGQQFREIPEPLRVAYPLEVR